MWIIAISLLAIAVCVVIDSIGRQKARTNVAEVAPVTNSSDERVAKPEPSRLRVASRARRLPSADASPESLPTSATAEETPVGPEVAVIPVAQSTVGGPQPVGYSVSSIATGSNGEIAGKITLNGTPPPETPVKTDPFCSERNLALTTHNFLVGESNGLANVVVSVKQETNTAAFSAPRTSVNASIKNCELQPYVSVVIAGQTMFFQDKDGRAHHLALGETNVTVSVARNYFSILPFPNPSPFVRLICRDHPWEKGFISVLANPFFAVTDKNGNFDIPNIPPGTYAIEIAHPAATGTNGVTRSVIVVTGKKAELNVALDVPK